MKQIGFMLVAVMLILTACTPKNQVIIDGRMDGADQVTIFLKVKEEKRWINMDSCIIEKGKFQLKGIVDEPQLAYLILEDQNLFPNTPIFLEPGKINVTCDLETSNVTIDGSKLNDEYYLMIEQADFFDNRYEQLMADYNMAQETGELMKIAAVKMQMDELDKEMELYKTDYIKNNPKSPISLVLITTELIYTATLQDLEELKACLDPSLYSSKPMKEIDTRIDVLKKFEPGQTVPEISLPDTADVVRNLSELRGKYVLIDFWASWCGPCRRENPDIVAAYQDFHGKGFDIFAISLDNRKEDWMRAIAADHLTWTHVSELSGWKGDVSQEFGIISIPSNLLIDPDGKIIARNLFGEPLRNQLMSIFNNIP